MRAVHKRYLREFFPAMAGYVLLLFFAVWLLPKIENLGLRAIIALLPMLPIALAIRAMFRVILGQDELERRIDLESIAMAAAVTGFGFFTYALLMSANVVARADGDSVAFWVLPSLFGSFGLAKCLVISHHYRGEAE